VFQYLSHIKGKFYTSLTNPVTGLPSHDMFWRAETENVLQSQYDMATMDDMTLLT
jgi:hypothetical protein